MSLDGVRAASRLVGRRTTLRYLAIGVGASLLAACTGNGNDDQGHGKAKGGGSKDGGSPSGATGVTGRAFAAFVRGSWKVTSQPPGASAEPFTFTITIGDGTWAMDAEGRSPKGTWALQDGRLALRLPERLDPDSSDTEEAAAANVPATVGDSVSLMLPWQPPGGSGTASGERLDVEYTKQAGLRIRHFDAHGSMTVHHCVRV
ncbi:hypothetical protein KBP30_23385 [Streptomyces sp. Go40/10]|uniref:hypothetical protein n=1 Tax=Streptomyces sp. Go40/10 TaxID=2825844 RepID=UPI001E528A0D|nr:hypothetical protein [Streptomyces sp. Go40/10]UFR03933.1 hypothetical protein KBP30_23385 [Streptomyces sp. Go40/10]